MKEEIIWAVNVSKFSIEVSSLTNKDAYRNQTCDLSSAQSIIPGVHPSDTRWWKYRKARLCMCRKWLSRELKHGALWNYKLNAVRRLSPYQFLDCSASASPGVAYLVLKHTLDSTTKSVKYILPWRSTARFIHNKSRGSMCFNGSTYLYYFS